MNSLAFVILGILTLASALAAAILPKLIHAALCLVLAFIGLACFYLLLGAEFVGLVQLLVYVGAVAVLIVFTVLLTRREQENPVVKMNWGGLLVALAVFAGLSFALFKTPLTGTLGTQTLTVKQIGMALMQDYIWPMEAIAILLTAALIGSLILVLEKKSR